MQSVATPLMGAETTGAGGVGREGGSGAQTAREMRQIAVAQDSIVETLKKRLLSGSMSQRGSATPRSLSHVSHGSQTAR